jgi:hypothetical protein
MLIITQDSVPLKADAAVLIAIWLWWAFDAEGLQTLAYANAPAWDRSVPGVELPVYEADKITTLATGTVAIVRALAKSG